MRFDKIKFWLAAALSLALVACGGGGSNSGTPSLGGGGGGSVNTSVTSLQVKFASASVDNTGSTTNKATVTALDANGKGVSGVALGIQVDKNATYSVAATSGLTTAADGTVVADVTIGNDQSLRTITLTASYAALSATGSFQVTGSKQLASDLTITASPAELNNSLSNTATITVVAVDASRNALANIPVSFSVTDKDAKAATLSPAGTVTGADGTITAVLRMGADQSNRDIEVTATSGGVSKTTTVKVKGAQLSVSSLAPQLQVNTKSVIKWVLKDNTGAAMKDVGYSIANGATVLQTGKTSAAGEFELTYTTPSTPQTVNLDATAGGASATATIAVVGTVVVPDVTVAIKSASVSASPAVVPVNLTPTSTNSAEIRALFIGENNLPVKNVRVWFDLGGDPQSIGGALDSTAGNLLLYSDANGVARTSYKPGARFSPKDGVIIRACWSKTNFDWLSTCPNSVSATLTVTSESLSVSIGTNNVIEKGASLLTYVKRYAVQVVDSAGNAKPGVQVSPSIDVLKYYKGIYNVPVGESFWRWGGFGSNYPSAYPSGTALPAEIALELARKCGTSCSTITSDWKAVSTTNPNRVLGGGGVAECDNEDLNRNGVAEIFRDALEGVDVSEDQNGSGALVPPRPMLDPRKADIAISVEGSSLTDANGIVVVRIEYPQNIASWVQFNILVSASGVAGTEGRANYLGILPVDATAIAETQKDPPFRISPYGAAATNIYPRRNQEGQLGWLCTNPN